MELATLVVLILTFIAILWYTVETKKLRTITEWSVKLNNQSINDNRFYTLLRTYQDIFDSIDYYHSGLSIHLKSDDALKTFNETYRAEEVLKLITTGQTKLQSRVNTFNSFYRASKNEYKNIQMLLNSFDAIILILKKIREINSNDYDVYKKHFQSIISNNTASVLFYYGLSNLCLYNKEIDETEIFIGLIDENNVIEIGDLTFYNQFQT